MASAPESPSHVSADAVPGGGKNTNTLPEPVRYLLGCLCVMLGGEVVHLILSVSAVVVDPSQLRESARQAAEAAGEEISDATITLAMYGSVATAALFQLLIIVLLGFAAHAVVKQASWGQAALRLLQFFGVFFAIRAILLFFLSPSSTTVPVALFAVDGVVQIIVGAAGACAVAYAMQDKVREHVRKQPRTGGAGPSNEKK